MATASAVGLYQAGSIIPAGVIAVLFTGFDTVYPHLAGTGDSTGQEFAVRFLTRVAAFIGGAVFATVILLHADVVRVVLGRPSALAESVLIVFCGIWLANLPAHGPGLAARRTVDSGSLCPWSPPRRWPTSHSLPPSPCVVGPIGAAVATLVTIAVSNLIVFPYLVRHDSPGWHRLGLHHGGRVAIMLVGAASAGIAVAPLLLLAPGLGRLIGGLFAGGVVSCALGLLLLRREGRSTLAAMLRRPAE